MRDLQYLLLNPSVITLICRSSNCEILGVDFEMQVSVVGRCNLLSCKWNVSLILIWLMTNILAQRTLYIILSEVTMNEKNFPMKNKT